MLAQLLLSLLRRNPFCAGSKHSYQIRRGVINATGLLMYLEARTKARSIPHLEADRKLVYIHHLSDASLLALTQASNAAPQRINLNSYRPCLTLDHTRGAHKSTEPKSGSLSWLYRSPDGRAGGELENARQGPRSWKGALKFLRADVPYIL